MKQVVPSKFPIQIPHFLFVQQSKYVTVDAAVHFFHQIPSKIMNFGFM